MWSVIRVPMNYGLNSIKLARKGREKKVVKLTLPISPVHGLKKDGKSTPSKPKVIRVSFRIPWLFSGGQYFQLFTLLNPEGWQVRPRGPASYNRVRYESSGPCS